MRSHKNQERSESPHRHPYSGLPLLLASGMGRSGTTVLRNCIAAHPDINCLNRESNYIFDLMRNANLHLDNPERVKNLVVSKNQFWQQHHQLILNLHWPSDSISSEASAPVLATYSMLDPRAAIGICNAFPSVSIVYIVRNGIEVVSSFVSFPGFRHIPFEQCCRNWALRYDMAQYAIYNDHATLVRYEWLENDVDKFSDGLTEALKRTGLAFDSECLKPLAKRFHPTRFEGESRADARDHSKRKDRWKLWSESERLQFQEICGETMNKLGYPIPWAV